MSSGPPTKQTRLYLAQQAEVFCLLQAGSNTSHVVTTYNVSQWAVTNIKKNMACIIVAIRVMEPISDDVSENCNLAYDSEQDNSGSVLLPSIAEIVSVFQDLESMALRNNLNVAIVHLRRTHQFFLSAKRQEGSETR